jgi:eukaryotic-like serine/threonine-protein kinase
MTSEDSHSEWQLKKELFQAALELPPAQREEFLKTQIRSESIRDEICRLLKMHASDDAFLSSPFELRSESSGSSARITDPYFGQSVNGFTIHKLLGLGGMGAVYLAKQVNPDRDVALKILNWHQHQTEKRIRRFMHEINVLAKLDHPGIAKIYSAGAFDFGQGLQRWFAMELANGETLSSFLKSNDPDLKHKIELLIQICEAVHHAHLRGVVHRDLKPSNILVSLSQNTFTRNDGEGEQGPKSVLASTKIVDFGIARIMDDSMDRPLTLDGEILGTLQYMSPEQLAGNPERVDGRSDVFAIGMIGFEMLTGELAYDRRGRSMSDIIARAGIDSPTRLRKVQPSFGRDLEAIFATALAPDQLQRYLSPRDLALDLKRFLDGERPLVRRPSLIYRTRRFVSLHRGLVFGTIATVVSLAIGLVFYASAAHRANSNATELKYEVDKAQTINDFITNDLVMRFLGASTGLNEEREDISRMVEEASDKIDIMFLSQPTNQAAVRNEVGTIFYNLRKFDRAEAEYLKAKAIWEAQLGPGHNDTLKAINNLGQTYLAQGKLEQAETLVDRAYRSRLAALGQDSALTINSKINLANVYMQTERISEAQQMLSEIVDRRTVWGQESDKSILAAMANLGAIHIKHGRNDEALQLHQRGYEIGLHHYGKDHPTTVSLTVRLAQTLHRIKRNEDAESLIEGCLPQLKASTGDDSLESINALRLLARIHCDMAKHSQAVDHLRQAERILEESKRDEALLKKVRSELSALEQGSQQGQR